MHHHSELSEVFRPHLQWHRARLNGRICAGLDPRPQCQPGPDRRCTSPPTTAAAKGSWPGSASTRKPSDGRSCTKPGAKAGLEPGSYRVEVGPPQHQPAVHRGGGVAYPLGKAGSSNLRERLGLLRRLLTFLPKARIVRIGSLPAPALRWRKVSYTLRIKAGSRVIYKGQSRPVQRLFRHLGKPCPNRFGCGGNPPIAEGEYLLLIRRPIPSRPLLDTPGAGRSKPSSGLRLRIHLTRAERMESLIAWMSIVLVWAHQVGEWPSRTKPIPIKTHARKLYSTFRCGLDYLRQLLFAPEARKTELYACMRLLSCT